METHRSNLVGILLLLLIGTSGSVADPIPLAEVRRITAAYNKLIAEGKNAEAVRMAEIFFPPEVRRASVQNGIARSIAEVSVAEGAIGDTSLQYDKVTHVFEREATELFAITFENGERLEATGDHPFWIFNRGWIPARNLVVGDQSRTATGEKLAIAVIEHLQLTAPIKVYNLEVERSHNFFVGHSGILVHNEGQYIHNKKLTVRHEPLAPFIDSFGRRLTTYGNTERKFDWQYEVASLPDGKYGIKMKRFEVSTQVVLNSEADWQTIKQFRAFYRADGRYTYADYHSNFNTKEGTTFHERLHQAQMDSEIKTAKPFIERSVGKIAANSPVEAKRAAEAMLKDFRKQIDANMLHPPTHQKIMLQEWQYYHREYEKTIKSGSR